MAVKFLQLSKKCDMDGPHSEKNHSPCHESYDADLDGDDGQGDPERADEGGDEDEGDEHHHQRGHQHALDRLRPDGQVLRKKRAKNMLKS